MTKARLLIVENDMVVASDLRARLQVLGYEVPALALSGPEALELAAETRPDLVLTDINLRGQMDGVSAAELLRTRFEVPVVYLTEYADDQTVARAKLSEPYGYLFRPFDPHELHTTIEIALYKHAIEKRLRESESKYRTLVEHSLQGIMVVQGLPLRILFVNPPCARIPGYTVAEMLSLSPEEALALVYPEDLPLLRERLVAHMAGEQVPASGQFRVIRKDGTVRWVEYFASRIVQAGQPAIQAGFLDITERKQAQEALEEAHNELEKRVQARTAELARTNDLLRAEINHRREAEEALQQRVEELHILNDLGRRVSASLSMAGFVDASLQAIARGSQCDLVLLYRRQGDALVLLGAHPAPPKFQENLPLHRLGRCLCGLAAGERQPVYSSNIHADERCTLEECKKAGMAAFAALPLCTGNDLLGVLGLASRIGRDFARQAAFLEALASQLAIGFDNALLYAEVQHRAAELEWEVAERRRIEGALMRQTQAQARANRLVSTLNQIAAHIQATLDPNEVLETLGSELQALGLASAVVLLVPETGGLVLHYVSVPPEVLVAADAVLGLRLSEHRIPLDAWPTREVVGRGRAVYLPDLSALVEPLGLPVPEALFREAIQGAGLSLDGQVACLPLAAEEQVAGALAVWGSDLREADVPALSILAAQVGNAFERARLARQAAEAEILREVDRLRSELIANVSHELRTPLGLIEVCCTSLLMDDVDLDPDTQRSFLVGIREETDRLKAIVDNLLNLSRLESGRWRLHRQPTDLGLLVREVATAMQPQLAAHYLVCNLPSSPATADVDPRQIRQVLSNLLNNAVKYSPGGGTIRVEGRTGGGQVVICVGDEGIGIPADERERVFERFYRVDCERTQVVPGAGLGLAVCQGIVEAHGGRIWVAQSSPAGSTFCFSLPASTAD